MKILAVAALALLAPGLCGSSSAEAQVSKEVLLARTAAYVQRLQVLAFLQSDYQANFEFELHGLAPAVGNGVREVRFNQPVDVALRGAVANLLAWIEEPTGRVLKTELRVGIGAATRITTTTFGFDPALRINVPVELRDAVPVGAQDEFLGRARYRRFRRFAVEANQSIEIPAVRP